MTSPPTPHTGNLGKILTKRIRCRDMSVVTVAYPTPDAQAIRALAQSIRLKGGTKPSLSLLTRRALHLYMKAFPAVSEAETRALNDMTTPVPQPAKRRPK